MLNRTFILINTIEEARQIHATSIPLVYPAFVVDLKDQSNLNEWINYCFGETPFPTFCLYLKNLQGDHADHLNDLTVLLSHSSYYKAGNRPYLLYSKQPGFLDDGLAVDIFLESQGFENEQILELPMTLCRPGESVTINNSGRSIIFCPSITSFGSDYEKYILGQYRFSDFLILNADASTEIPRIIAILNKTRLDFMSRYPYLNALLEQLANREEATINQAAQVGLLKKELSILEELFELRSANDEMERVLNFYHKEYEILPLWYKRVGHVIKVLIGKRKLRSLFYHE